jgi:hypothetical protein
MLVPFRPTQCHDRLDGHVEVGDELEHERLEVGRKVHVRRNSDMPS